MPMSTTSNPLLEQFSGRFVVLDGPDGAGKSTQARLLSERLQQRGIVVQLIREPGGTAAGESIRALLLEKRANSEISALAETFLFQAARAQLIKEVIKPALSKGHWIVCDRFTLSTFVYQGLAGGVSTDAIETLSRLATDGLSPDCYLVLWLPLDSAAGRRTRRGEADRMESKGEKFLADVSAAYRTFAEKSSAYKLIDASGTVEQVQESIWRQVEPLIESHKTPGGSAS